MTICQMSPASPHSPSFALACVLEDPTLLDLLVCELNAAVWNYFGIQYYSFAHAVIWKFHILFLSYSYSVSIFHMFSMLQSSDKVGLDEQRSGFHSIEATGIASWFVFGVVSEFPTFFVIVLILFSSSKSVIETIFMNITSFLGLSRANLLRQTAARITVTECIPFTIFFASQSWFPGHFVCFVGHFFGCQTIERSDGRNACNFFTFTSPWIWTSSSRWLEAFGILGWLVDGNRS